MRQIRQVPSPRPDVANLRPCFFPKGCAANAAFVGPTKLCPTVISANGYLATEPFRRTGMSSSILNAEVGFCLLSIVAVSVCVVDDATISPARFVVNEILTLDETIFLAQGGVMQQEHPLRQWRRANKITLSELAARLGCSIAHLSEVETRGKDVSLNLARKLSHETGLPLETIVNGAAGNDRQPVTAEMAVAIEKATGGVVSRQELRPDLWPQEAAE